MGLFWGGRRCDSTLLVLSILHVVSLTKVYLIWWLVLMVVFSILEYELNKYFVSLTRLAPKRRERHFVFILI
jgi:uncharacterized membrane-anchored protein